MYKVNNSQTIYAMSLDAKPVLTVDPNSQIEFETLDCFTGQIQSETQVVEALDWDRINPATGPVFINGAEPGDILSVKIESITVADYGTVVTGKDMGVLGDILTENTVKIIPIIDDTAVFSEHIRIPLNKMIGVIGTAPADGAIACGVPGVHGGNMDCKEIKEGATLLLPVFVPGALLAIGDLHAVMADGESCVCGLETSGSVKVTVDIIKNKQLPLPMLLSDTHIMTIYSDETLDSAVHHAVINMAEYLVKEKGFRYDEAAMLISLVGDVRICQVVDPQKTVRVELDKKYVAL